MILGTIKKTLFLLTLNIIISSTGYIRQTEISFCMDECSMYYLESEFGEYISNISFGEFEPSIYINRYVTIDGIQISCVECTALQIQQINLSQDCESPFACFADPCEVAEECQLNTPVECIPNYCGGCYADFYDLENNLVDCNTTEFIEECYDIGDIFFGECDMYMGVAVSNGACQGVSGCGWISDGIDYSDAFFDSITDCEEYCLEEFSCQDIESDYEQFFIGDYAQCEYNNDCVAIWGDCGVGLGGCHYSINPDYFDNSSIDNLVIVTSASTQPLSFKNCVYIILPGSTATLLLAIFCKTSSASFPITLILPKLDISNRPTSFLIAVCSAAL